MLTFSSWNHAGCSNWWGCGCYNFWVDGIYAFVRGDYFHQLFFFPSSSSSMKAWFLIKNSTCKTWSRNYYLICKFTLMIFMKDPFLLYSLYWIVGLLLLQSMLGSIIYARDRWLKPGGLILPSNATVSCFSYIIFSFDLLCNTVANFCPFVLVTFINLDYEMWLHYQHIRFLFFCRIS